MATVAEILVETLALSGAKRMYGFPGDSLNGVIDVIRNRDDMNWIYVGTRRPPPLLREPRPISLVDLRV